MSESQRPMVCNKAEVRLFQRGSVRQSEKQSSNVSNHEEENSEKANK